MQQIRLTKTPELEQVLSYLRDKYRLLSEAEIIKLALSEKYQKDLIKPVVKEENAAKERELRKAYKHAMEEGHKIGDKLLAERGLKREDMSEQEIYDTFLDDHKHNS